MVKFVYAERLALYFLDIFFTHLYKRIKNNESKVDSIISPTPVYLIFFYLWVGKMVSLPLQMYPRTSLKIFRANDSVLNDNKR